MDEWVHWVCSVVCLCVRTEMSRGPKDAKQAFPDENKHISSLHDNHVNLTRTNEKTRIILILSAKTLCFLQGELNNRNITWS